MRKIRHVLRLAWEAGLPRRQIARSLNLSPTTVGEYLQRAQAAGLSWPLPEVLDDSELETRLFSKPAPLPRASRPLPQWPHVHRELKRKGVTLWLLWQGYKAVHPDGLQYSQFCERYRRYVGGLDLVMRQHHRAGERLFVDYAGQTVAVVDPSSGEIRAAQIFVATLGTSNYTYAEATWSQSLPDWIGAHIRVLEFLGAVPAVLTPDNLKSGVRRVHRYEPDLNPTYAALAAHYGTAIVPARARKPRDKAKVENAVLVVERWVLVRLRHCTFFSLAELNAAIAALITELNERPFKKLAGSRRTLFETLDRPAMKPLPGERFEYAEWKKVRVHVDYHVEVEGHYYSVSYQLVKCEIEARLTAHAVELLHRGRRVASHRRCAQKGRHTTVAEHMPRAHRAYAGWTPQRLVRWAEHSGPATARVVSTLLASRPHPQQGFRSCLGIMRLGKHYGDARLEAACERALRLGAPSYKSLESILRQGLERTPLPETDTASSPQPIEHANLRGADYYH